MGQEVTRIPFLSFVRFINRGTLWVMATRITLLSHPNGQKPGSATVPDILFIINSYWCHGIPCPYPSRSLPFYLPALNPGSPARPLSPRSPFIPFVPSSPGSPAEPGCPVVPACPLAPASPRMPFTPP